CKWLVAQERRKVADHPRHLELRCPTGASSTSEKVAQALPVQNVGCNLMGPYSGSFVCASPMRQRSGSRVPVVPANAARNAAMSILTIFIIASDARLALARSAEAILSPRTAGTICHERPKRSYSQRHGSAEPP